MRETNKMLQERLNRLEALLTNPDASPESRRETIHSSPSSSHLPSQDLLGPTPTFATVEPDYDSVFIDSPISVARPAPSLVEQPPVTIPPSNPSLGSETTCPSHAEFQEAGQLALASTKQPVFLQQQTSSTSATDEDGTVSPLIVSLDMYLWYVPKAYR